MSINTNFRSLQASNVEGVVAPRNYLTNSFENDSIVGFSLFNTTLTSGLPTGTISAGASSLTATITSTNPLSETYSLQVAAASTWTAGQGFISNVFTCDRQDLGKVLTSTFSYEVVSGSANANFSAVLGSQTFAVYIYDVTASAWVQPAGFLGIVQGSNPAVSAPITFQTSVTSGQQYQLAFIALQASTGAITLNFDNFVCSNKAVVTGAAMTDWVSYTPTGSWSTNTTYTGKWRRAGDSMEVSFALSLSGAPNNTSLTVNIPSGYTIDTTKINSNALTSVFGSGNGNNSNGGVALQVVYNGTSSVDIIYINNGTTSSQGQLSSTLPSTWASGNSLGGTFMVPIVGWSSNTVQSSDTDTRVVAMQITGTATATVSASYSLLKFTGTPASDTHGAFSNSTGLYTVPVSGYYRTSMAVDVAAAYASNAYSGVGIAKNSTVIQSSSQVSATGQTNLAPSGAFTVFCNAGDTLAPYVVSNQTGATVATNLGTSNNYFTVERLSGPSVIAATESVNARYNTSSTSITTGGNTVVYTSKTYDSHNAYNTSTGAYTCPVSGKYSISAAIQFVGFTLATNAVIVLNIIKNGSSYSQISQTAGSGSSLNWQTWGSDTVQCNAGDVITLAASNSSGTEALVGNANNYFAIERVGN